MSIFGNALAAIMASVANAASGFTSSLGAAPPPAAPIGDAVDKRTAGRTGMLGGGFWEPQYKGARGQAPQMPGANDPSARWRETLDDGSYWEAGVLQNEGGDIGDGFYQRDYDHELGQWTHNFQPMTWDEFVGGRAARRWADEPGFDAIAPHLQGQASPTERWKAEQAALDALPGAMRLERGRGLEELFMSDPDAFVVRDGHTYYGDTPLYIRDPLWRYNSGRPDAVQYLSTQQHDDSWKQLGELRESDFEDSDFEKAMDVIAPLAVWGAPMFAAGLPGPGGLGAAFGGGTTGGMLAGAGIGALTGGMRGDDILQSALAGGLGGGSASALGSSLATTAGLPEWLGKGITGVGAGMLGGGDFEDALKNYAIGQGTGAAADFAAPYVSDFVDSVGSGDWLAGAADDEILANLDQQDVDAVSPELQYTNAALNNLDVQDMEATSPAFRDTFGFNSLANLDQQDAEATSPELAKEPLTVTGEDLQKYAKIAKTVDEVLGSPEDAPQRAEGQTEAAYQEQLVEYLGLDVETMAAAGLQPGTQEYTDYILDQADRVIEQILGDVEGVDAEELSAMLRSKTADEQMQLQRALYVRGQLGTSVNSGTYTDPFSGTQQEVMGEGFNPSVAAHQRGLASDVDTLAGMGGEEGFDFLQGMLNRDVDLFGMQGRADARYEQALREQQLDDERKRRRGMFSY